MPKCCNPGFVRSGLRAPDITPLRKHDLVRLKSRRCDLPTRTFARVDDRFGMPKLRCFWFHSPNKMVTITVRRNTHLGISGSGAVPLKELIPASIDALVRQLVVALCCLSCCHELLELSEKGCLDTSWALHTFNLGRSRTSRYERSG